MIAIAGSTGHTGSATAEALLAAGARIRVVVRRAEAGDAWSARGAEVAVADLRDAHALASALQGADGVYLLNPLDYAFPDPFGAAQRQGEVFSRAIAASGVARVVVLSSIGAQHAGGNGIIRTLHLIEQALGGSSTPIAFVRACYFLENWAQVLPVVRAEGVLPSFLAPLDRTFPMVAVADIGTQVAELLHGPAWTGRRVVELSGATDPTPNAVAAALADVLGRPVRATVVQREQWAGILASSGFAPAVIDAFVEMYDGILSGRVAAEEGNERRRGRLPLQAALSQLVQATS